MILSEIAIENFRSIKNCKIQIREISALIGENNAGKTALLRAINSVFNWDFEEKYFLNNSHQHAIKTVSKIILTFDDVPNKDYYLCTLALSLVHPCLVTSLDKHLCTVYTYLVRN